MLCRGGCGGRLLCRCRGGVDRDACDAQQKQHSAAGGTLTSTIAVVVDVQPRTLLRPVEVVPGVVAAPAAPHLVLSAWILVSEPTSSAPKVKALPTCRQLQKSRVRAGLYSSEFAK